ncbi:ABC transporter permease [Boudabousia marimammalium]|uniref:ABC transporter permease n=1 Tax=Boudabousia marimammalium TaxID=156892 RepID=A0A1Q5PRM8_9ACTO|nr:ABC transporter permease [Boudabousia marimammalium]OKL50244.1 ABC transporter permease [Boudabousia marimammalium]
MIKYVLRKIVSWLVMIFFATNITYFLATQFLDPRANYAERKPPIPPEQIRSLLEPKNLYPETPLLERWWNWLTGILLHWDWGLSPTGSSVNESINYSMWVSARLLLGATIISTIVGISLGIYTASRQYKLGDRIWQGVSVVSLNTHIVVAGLLVVLLGIAFNNAVGTTVFYVSGSSTPNVSGWWAVVDSMQHLFLPTVALILVSFAGTHLLQRSLLLDNINADYVRTARAKGLQRHQAIRKHALRTSVIPVATQVAFSVPGIFAGAILTETIFGWNGMGKYAIQTLAKNDVHGLVASAAFGALMTAIGAILADIAVVALDPRVRVS